MSELIRICIECNVELTPENFSESRKKKHHYVCNDCWNKYFRGIMKRWVKNNRKKFNKNQRKSHRRLYEKYKMEIFALLGNKCANPFNLNHGDFESDINVLQIDHIHGGGRKERRRITGVYYLYILKQILSGSKDYQLLCANCNYLKKQENKEKQRRID